MTAFEPESLGNLVAGMDFHKFYFDNGWYAFVLFFYQLILSLLKLKPFSHHTAAFWHI